MPFKMTSIDMLVTTGNAYYDELTGDSLTSAPLKPLQAPALGESLGP